MTRSATLLALHKNVTFAVAAISVLASCSPLFAQELSHSTDSRLLGRPYGFEHVTRDPYGFNSSPMALSGTTLQVWISLYQRFISKNECQFLPSCSRNGYMAIQRAGEPVGLALAIERWWRCNSRAEMFYPAYAGFLLDFSGASVRGSPTIQPSLSLADSGNYVSWLESHGEVEAAYDECLREEYAHPSSSTRSTLARLAIADKRYEKSLHWLRDDTSASGVLMRAQALCSVGEPAIAHRLLDDHPRGDREYSRKRSALLLHVFAMDPEQIDMEQATAAAIDLQSDLVSGNLAAKLSLCKVATPWKTRTIIASAIIPGSGQLLEGFWEEGISALVFSVGFGYLSQESFRHELTGQGVLFGLGFLASYAANLISAYATPNRTADRYRIWLHDLMDQVIPVDELMNSRGRGK